MISLLIRKYFYFILFGIICFTVYMTLNSKKVIPPKKHKKRVTFKLDNIKPKKHKNHKKQKKKEIHDLVFLDIAMNGEKLGRVIIELFSKIVPMTCKNFRTLCVNKNGMTYKGCAFHRIIKDFMIQGGDFDGSGGQSIYGERFDDENFELQHDRPYLLSMANHGENTNGSQFFITTAETPHLDNKHVVFGCVVDGFEIIDELNEVNTDANDRPYDKIVIYNCGQIQQK